MGAVVITLEFQEWWCSTLEVVGIGKKQKYVCNRPRQADP
jgi:hypothetical protein